MTPTISDSGGEKIVGIIPSEKEFNRYFESFLRKHHDLLLLTAIFKSITVRTFEKLFSTVIFIGWEMMNI